MKTKIQHLTSLSMDRSKRRTRSFRFSVSSSQASVFVDENDGIKYCYHRKYLKVKILDKCKDTLQIKKYRAIFIIEIKASLEKMCLARGEAMQRTYMEDCRVLSILFLNKRCIARAR